MENKVGETELEQLRRFNNQKSTALEQLHKEIERLNGVVKRLQEKLHKYVHFDNDL